MQLHDAFNAVYQGYVIENKKPEVEGHAAHVDHILAVNRFFSQPEIAQNFAVIFNTFVSHEFGILEVGDLKAGLNVSRVKFKVGYTTDPLTGAATFSLHTCDERALGRSKVVNDFGWTQGYDLKNEADAAEFFLQIANEMKLNKAHIKKIPITAKP